MHEASVRECIYYFPSTTIFIALRFVMFEAQSGSHIIVPKFKILVSTVFRFYDRRRLFCSRVDRCDRFLVKTFSDRALTFPLRLLLLLR